MANKSSVDFTRVLNKLGVRNIPSNESDAGYAGARLFRYRFKGGFCRNIPRTEQEAFEIIASTGLAEDSTSAREVLSNLVSGGWVYYGKRETPFGRRRFRVVQNNNRYSIETVIWDSFGDSGGTGI